MREFLRTLVLPPTGPLLLIVVGLLLAWKRPRSNSGLALAAMGAASLWLLATPIVAGGFARWAEFAPALDLDAPVEAQAIVILAGGSRENAPEYASAAPNDLSLQRLAYGAYVARRTGLPVLLSGGDGEGAAMARRLREDFQIEPEWVESRSRDTHGNALFSAQVLRAQNVRTVVLVTSALHMRRAAAEFETHGLSVAPAPVDVSAPFEFEWSGLMPGMKALRESHYVLYETLGEIVRRITEGA